MQKLIIIVAILISLFIDLSGQNIKINEFQAANFNTIADENGEFDDWIEIANFSNKPLNLKGYYISDDIANLQKFKFSSTVLDFIVPVHGYILLWADNEPRQGATHLNFKLSKENDFICLSDPSGKIVDSISYINLLPGCSMGRDGYDHSTLKYFSIPTPKESNTLITHDGICSAPIFSNVSGVYSTPVSLTLSSKYNEQIKYTIANENQTSNSLTYGLPININKSTVVFAKSTKSGWIDSWPNANVYLFNIDHALPILTITVENEEMFGKNGIYTRYDQTGLAWQKPCQLHFIDNNVERSQINAGIAIQGHSSVFMRKKSFRVYFKERFGNASFKDTLFGTNNVREFENLVFKSGYDDDVTIELGTLLRDPLSAELWKSCGGLSTASNFKVLYINDSYWGIYNLRESVNDDFVKAHTGMQEFDMIRFNYENMDLKYGSYDNYNKLKSIFTTTDFSKQESFSEVGELLDMDYFINLMAFVQCTQYKGWSWGCSLFRGYYKDAKWRWTIWDTDRSYADLSWSLFKSLNNGMEEGFGKYLPRALLKNPEFNQRLINRSCDLMNTIFHPDSSIRVLDSLYKIIKPEIPNELMRWAPNDTAWEDNVDFLRKFLRQRPDSVKKQMGLFFKLPEMHKITLNVSGKGIIRVNTVFAKAFPWKGEYYKDNLIEIEALPAPGYSFVEWKNKSTNSKLSVNLETDSNYEAIFEKNGSYKPDIVITEICYKQTDKAGDWIELYNPTDFAVNMSGWLLRDKNETNKFILPTLTLIPPKGYLVVAQDQEKFASRYTGVVCYAGSFGVGDSGFGLNDLSEKVLLMDSEGNFVDSVSFKAVSPWPVLLNDITRSIQLKSPAMDNQNPENWVMSELACTPGLENVGSKLSVVSDTQLPLISIYPNPASNIVNIEISLQSQKLISTEIYDLTGKRIANLESNNLRENLVQTYSWYCSQYLSGLYVLLVKTDHTLVTKKILLVK